jgi:hypothetical protein
MTPRFFSRRPCRPPPVEPRSSSYRALHLAHRDQVMGDQTRQLHNRLELRTRRLFKVSGQLRDLSQAHGRNSPGPCQMGIDRMLQGRDNTLPRLIRIRFRITHGHGQLVRVHIPTDSRILIACRIETPPVAMSYPQSSSSSLDGALGTIDPRVLSGQHPTPPDATQRGPTVPGPTAPHPLRRPVCPSLLVLSFCLLIAGIPECRLCRTIQACRYQRTI